MCEKNKKNVDNKKIYILTPYSGYFGKIPGILGSRIIKICANIKLNKVVYIKLLNKSISTFLLKYIKNRVLLYFHSSKIEKAVLLLLLE